MKFSRSSLLAALAAAAWAGSLLAPPSFSTSTSFTAADGVRTYMDVAGAWNGTTDVSASLGDTFTFTLGNGAGATSAFDLAYSVTLPAGFSYVTGTAAVQATGAGCGSAPSVSASQVGQDVTFTLTPSGYDLPADCSLAFSYGLKAGTSVVGGTYAIQNAYDYALVDGGALQGPTTVSHNILVKEGATLLTVSPSTQTKAVAQDATFTLSACNTGLGGLYDVTLTNAFSSLSLVSFTQTGPVSPAATGTGNTRTLPYLAPSTCFTATVVATVNGCATIQNSVESVDRSHLTPASALASVTLDFNTPLIAYTPPSKTVPFTGTVNVSFPVQNTGLGSAFNVDLQTNLESLPLNVTNVAAGWSYNSSTGNFSRTGGTIANGASLTLSFDLEQTQCQPASGNYNIFWRSTYADGCGNPYVVPSVVEAITIGGTVPVTIAKSGPSRLNLGESGTWNVTVTPNSLSQLHSDPVVVTDTISSSVTGVSLGTVPAGTTANCGGPCAAGSTVTWTIPKAALSGALTLPINFTAPSNPCLAGTAIGNSATIDGTWGPVSPVCPFSRSASSTVYIAQTPGFSSSQSYNIDNGATGSLKFETGVADDGDGIYESANGEGEFIHFTNGFTFGGLYPGTWTSSTYRDDFAGLAGQTLVSGSLTISLDGGPAVPVPGGSITSTTGSLGINLDFLAGPLYFNEDVVANHRIDFSYRTTVNDSDLPLPQASRNVVGVASLKLNGGATGCTGTGSVTFSQPIPYTIYRSSAALSFSAPSTIDVCQTFNVTATSATAQNSESGAWNPLITQSTTGNYDYITGQTPTYGGTFNAGNITYAENGGTNPTFTRDGAPVQQTANGSATYQMRLKASSSTTPSALTGTVAYDDLQSQALPRDFTASGSYTPTLVRKGDLSLIVTPSTLYVRSNRAQFRIYVVNGGDGTAYNVELKDILPNGITPNAPETDALNIGIPVVVAGQQMTWTLNNLAPGASQTIEVVGTVSGGVCSIPAGSNSITVTWGCGGTNAQSVSSTLPNFQFPSGSMMVLHDTTETQAGVCDPSGGRDVIIVRNTGGSHVYNITLNEVLNPLTTGIDISGAVEYSTNGGSTWNAIAGATGGMGTTGSPYSWNSTNVSALGDLGTQAEGGVYEVRIRFPVSGNELTNGSPTITASGSGTVACGTSVSSPGTGHSISVRRPNMVVSAAGKNVTNAGSFASTVYGRPGDTVQWRMTLANNGTYTAKHVDFTDDIPNTSVAPSGLLNGGSHVNTALSDNVAVGIDDITNSTSPVYTIDTVLGATCVNTTNAGTITWGCGTTPLTSPTNNSASANLVMNPNFTATPITQTWTARPGGNGEIAVTITNTGAVAANLKLTETLITGFKYDSTFTPVLSGTGSGVGNITGYALDGASTATVPVFNFTGELNQGKAITLTFRVYQDTAFDTNAATDPTLPATGNNTADLSFDNGCSNNNSVQKIDSFDPLTPDVDVTVSPTTSVVQSGTQYTYDFTLRNNGDAGSTANNVTFTPTIGAGWTGATVTVQTPGTGGTGGVCAGTCTAAQIGTLAQNGTAVVRVVATANSNGNPLTMLGLARGELSKSDGTLLGNDYSYDTVQASAVGYQQSLTIVGTSESYTTYTATTANLAIGEEVTFRLRAQFFGSDPGDANTAFTTISLKDVLPSGFGYVSHSDTVNHTAAYTISGNTPVNAGAITFTLSDITSAAGGIFEVDLVARLLNVGGNTAGASVINPFGARFTSFGGIIKSNSALDAFPAGGTSSASLHSQLTSTVVRPTLTFDKQVRNVTVGSSFANSTGGDAGDELEYRIVIGNSGTAPAFDLTITDTLSAKLSLVSGSADMVDNDGDGAVDGADLSGEGSFATGSGGTVTFDHSNTGLSSGSSLQQLNPSSTVTLLYRATINTTAIPNEILPNSAAAAGSTLLGPTGSQTGSTGATGTATGEATITASDVANTQVTLITFLKGIQTTSLGSNSTDVLIGEQVKFRLSLELPEGTTPNLVVNDSLPQGLLLVDRTAPAFGASISGCNSPSALPASLPASGNPQALSWTFGTCSVAAGTSGQRTITIDYVAQVRNIAGNVAGTTLANSANYTFTGYTSSSSTVTLTVRSPNINTFTVSVSPSTATIDAGDEITYTVSMTNNGTVTAYDLNIADTLPAAVTYKAGSTTMISAGTVLSEPDVSGQNLVWGRNKGVPQTVDLAAGATLSFTYKATLNNSVEPDQTLQNSVVMDYTSLSGNPGPDLGVAVGTAGAADGERNGSGVAPNTFRQTGSATATVKRDYTVVKAKSGDTLGPGFRVGDIVTYTLTATLQEGTVDQFKILDTMPSGLEFLDWTAISPASGAGGFTYTTPAGVNAPTAGATGAISWNLGTVVSDGDNVPGNQTLTLVYRATVKNVGGVATTPTSQTLNNSARLTYVDFADAAEVSATSTSGISVLQPSLTFAKALRAGQSASVTQGSSVAYRLTATNAGNGPAYNVVVVDTLPSEMRTATPSVVSVLLNGVSTSVTPTYSALTGVLTFSLGDAQVLNAGQQLVIDFDATVNSNAGGGLSLVNSAQVTEYYSLASAGSPGDRRQYAATTASTATVTTPAPTDMGKTQSAATPNIGETITYTLRVPETAVNVVLYDVAITDVVPAGMVVTNVTEDGVGTGWTNNTSSNNVSGTFATIPANSRATITVTALVKNVVGNQDGTTIANTASYTWAKSAGGPAQAAITSPTRTLTVKEPVLTIDETFVSEALSSPGQGLQKDDTIRYRITMTNTGSGPAHDLTLRAVNHDALIYDSIIANPDNPGAPVNSGSSGGFTTWTWTIPGPLAVGATYTFDVVFKLGAVQPYQNLLSTADVKWTSLSGTGSEERDGSGGINDYAATDPTPVTRTTGPVTFSKIEKAPAPGLYAVGQTVTYSMTMSFISGQTKNVRFVDSLPAGLVYVSNTFTSFHAQKAGGGSIALSSEPTAGATGTLTFDFDDIESTGANPTLTLELTARVRDVVGNVAGATITNVAVAKIENPNTPSTDVTIASTSDPVITVTEPNLRLTLDAPATIPLGIPVTLTGMVTNVGTSAGYQPVVKILLPSGMRNADPTGIATITASINRSGTTTLTSGVDFTPSYVSGTGTLTLTFTSAQSFVAVGETLTFATQVRLDNDQTASNTYTPQATVTSFNSRDQSAGATPENRTTTHALGSGTMGTANGGVADDFSDDASLLSTAPTLTVVKSIFAVNPSIASVGSVLAAPGAVVTYRILITNGGASAAPITSFVDDLPVEFAANTLANGSLTPSVGTTSGSLTLSGSGGVNSTGRITLSGATIAASGGTLLISFDATLKSAIANHTVVKNQSTMSVSGFTNPFLSDSNLTSDNDGVDTGNNASDGDDDDPTTLTIQSAPSLHATKVSSDVNGAPLAPGETLTYTITLTNTGNENAKTAVLTDGIPSNSTYVAGSTKLNGVTVPDVSGTSPLVAGLSVNGMGDAAGKLNVGSTATISFSVTVNMGVANGTAITNQASLTAYGEGNDQLTTKVSDDPRTSLVDDPTVDIVGTGPLLRAQKTVVDVNGGASLLPNEDLQYTIVVRNVGASTATNLVFTDQIPTDTSYVASSLEYDSDGPSTGAGYVALTDSGDSDAGDYNVSNAGKITLNRASLASGSEFSLRFKVKTSGTSNGKLISNQGQITSTELPVVYTDADAVPSNGSQPTDIVVGTGGKLKLSKAVSDVNGGTLLPGETLLYTMVMRNVGTTSATNVTITDTGPTPAMTYVANSTYVDGRLITDSSGNSQLVAGLNLGTLAAGATATITYRVTVPPATPNATRIVNQASFTASAGTLTGISDSDLDDALETGNDAGDPHDDDPTKIEVGSAQGVAAIRGNVWIDLDFDRHFGAGEVGQPGWKVEMILNGRVVATGVTDSNGGYYINGLVPGPGYSLRFRHPTTDVVYGSVVSNEPGVTTTQGMISGLNLPSGLTIIDQNLPLDPNGKVYNSVTRQPVSGAIVDMTGPATFDPTTMLMPGQHNQVTAADGFYRFDILPTAPAGTYTIVVTNPAGFLPGASTIIPATAGPLVTLSGSPAPPPYQVVTHTDPPTGSQATTYYYSFDIQIGNPNQPEIVNNHIPIDPILKGAIVATKRTPFLNVRRGDLVPYTLILKNQYSATLPNIDVTDTLPPGFKYLEGSARLNGNPLEPTRTGRVLNWANQTFTSQEEKVYQIVTVVGAGVGQGEYTNQVVAINNVVSTEVSNVATAAVRVVPDETFDCPELIGKVFDDRNRNGIQDAGEPGLPGVRIATARGWLVTTDQYGRYHIACPMIPRETIGSNFILKVDERTLPTGYRVTTENPYVVRLTMGKMTKANFGASIHRVVRVEVKDEAFENDGPELKQEWKKKLKLVVDALTDPRSVVRLAYYVAKTDDGLVRKRLDRIRDELKDHWRKRQPNHPLTVEEEISWAKKGVYE